MPDVTREAIRTVALELVALEASSRNVFGKTERERRDEEVKLAYGKRLLAAFGLMDVAGPMMAEARAAEKITEAQRLLTAAWMEYNAATGALERERRKADVEAAVRNLALAEERPYLAGTGGSATGGSKAVARQQGRVAFLYPASGAARTVAEQQGTSELAIDEWQPNTAYAVDDVVTYSGSTYSCIQAHTSQVGWEPPNVPALWSLVT